MKTLGKMKLPAQLAYLREALHFVVSAARDQGFTRQRLGELELAVEEVLVNICNYAYPQSEGNVEITCRQDAERFTVEIEDRGVSFDFLSAQDPDLSVHLDQRRIGGLGIFLVKKLADDVRYRREGDRNILTLTVCRPSLPAAPEG
jgi:serine/threonine-protein kinase RsbW